MNKKSKKQKIVLDAEERAIERALERGEYSPVSARTSELRRAGQMARATFAKTKTINIRLSERDLVRLRAKANRDGIPYQTFIASLVRKAVG